MNVTTCVSVSILILATACGSGSSSSPAGSADNNLNNAPSVSPTPVPNPSTSPAPSPSLSPTPSHSPTPPPTPVVTPTPGPSGKIVPDEDINLDPAGETFAKAVAKVLTSSFYMEQSCTEVDQWQDWAGYPMKHCRYRTEGQTAEVLLLNPGVRRMAMWIEDACLSFAKSKLTACMSSTLTQIILQSGGQFPVAGIVIEDMDGNGRGNAYAFRNGVTVSIPAFSTGSEHLLNQAQIDESFTQTPNYTYTYARPISLTREGLTAYAKVTGLMIPTLGTSSQRLNIFNQTVGDLYRRAWTSTQNHLIRAWVYSRKF